MLTTTRSTVRHTQGDFKGLDTLKKNCRRILAGTDSSSSLRWDSISYKEKRLKRLIDKERRLHDELKDRIPIRDKGEIKAKLGEVSHNIMRYEKEVKRMVEDIEKRLVKMGYGGLRTEGGVFQDEKIARLLREKKEHEKYSRKWKKVNRKLMKKVEKHEKRYYKNLGEGRRRGVWKRLRSFW